MTVHGTGYRLTTSYRALRAARTRAVVYVRGYRRRAETCWRMKAPSGKVLTCGIYETAAGLEVRCQYSDDDLVRSQLAPKIGTARDIAEEWRRAVLAKGGFQELTDAGEGM